VQQQQSEPAGRILELARIMLDAGADPALRRYFRTFLHALSVQAAATRNGSRV